MPNSVQLKFTSEELSNIASQRPDIFRSLPPAEHDPDDPVNVFTIEVPPDVATILNGLDLAVRLEPVPAEVALYRARYVMQITQHEDGTLLDAALTAISQISNANDKLLAETGFEYSNVLTRNGRLVQMIASSLGLGQSQLDDLFRQAAQIDV